MFRNEADAFLVLLGAVAGDLHRLAETEIAVAALPVEPAEVLQNHAVTPEVRLDRGGDDLYSRALGELHPDRVEPFRAERGLTGRLGKHDDRLAGREDFRPALEHGL